MYEVKELEAVCDERLESDTLRLDEIVKSLKEQ